MGCEKAVTAPPPPEPTMGYDSLEPGVQDAIRAAIEAIEAPETTRIASLAWLQLAMCYHGNELLPEACTCYQVTQKLDPGLGQAWHGHGLALADLGKPLEAIGAFQQALSNAPGYAPAAWNAGYLHLELGQLQQAQEQFEAALKIEPSSPAARVGLARTALNSNQPVLAASILEALRLDTSNTYLNLLLAKAYRQQNRVEEAAVLLAAGIDDPPRFSDAWSDAILDMGQSYEALISKIDRRLGDGSNRKAIQIARAALKRHPDNIPLLNRISVAQSSLGQRDQALRTLKRVLRLDEQSAVTHLNLSMQYQAAKDLSQAHRHAQRSAELNPTLPEAHLQVGRIHLLNNDVFAAANAYSRAFDLGAQDIDERLLYANMLTRTGRFGDSAAQYMIVLKQQPSNGQALGGMVDVYMVSGDLERAARAAQIAMAKAPEHPTVQKVFSSLQARIRNQQQGSTTP